MGKLPSFAVSHSSSVQWTCSQLLREEAIPAAAVIQGVEIPAAAVAVLTRVEAGESMHHLTAECVSPRGADSSRALITRRRSLVPTWAFNPEAFGPAELVPESE